MKKTTKRIEKLAPEQIGVKTLSLDVLQANPHNPRVLFDQAPLDTLMESIKKVGVLVPLTVYFDPKRRKYIILDGQRRWICAQKLELKRIPVNQVSEPTLVQNIVTMFQIHKLREDWDLMPSALKLQVLMDELQERNDKKLATLTGLDQAVVQRCKKLLSYPRKYQDMMLDPDPEKRIKADFFIELHVVLNDRFVGNLEWFSKDKFIRQMLDRYLTKNLRSVTDFRRIKQAINQARIAGQDEAISIRLREFAEDKTIGIEHLEVAEAAISAEARSFVKQAKQFSSFLEDLDVDNYIGEEEFWTTLEQLQDRIRVKLLESGRRSR